MNMPVFCAWLSIICEWLVHLLPLVAYLAIGIGIVKAADALGRFIEKRRKRHGKSIHER